MPNSGSIKVEIFLVGGLGNQLFGWATGLSLARKLGAKLILNTSQLGIRKLALPIHLYQPAEISEKVPVYYRTKSNLLRRIYRNIPIFDSYFERDFNFENRFNSIEGSVKLHGFFQSYKYFEENIGEIISLINNRENLTKQYLNIENSFPNEFVAIHFRRGDYLLNQDYHPLATMEYYEKALNHLDSKGCNFPKIVFTDDGVLAKEAFPNYIIVSESELKDPFDNLYIMSKARAIIGANSSFSLWAGFSINSRDGICIFPKHWFGGNDMRDKSPVPSDFLQF